MVWRECLAENCVAAATPQRVATVVASAEGDETLRRVWRVGSRMPALSSRRPGHQVLRARECARERTLKERHPCRGGEVSRALRELPPQASLERTKRVGVTGFEPATTRTQNECATRLRYTPYPSDTRDHGPTQGPRRVDEPSESKRAQTKTAAPEGAAVMLVAGCDGRELLLLFLRCGRCRGVALGGVARCARRLAAGPREVVA